MEAHPDLIKFLSPYSEVIQDLTWDLRSFILATIPTVNELIWDNYNALAIAYSKSTQLKDAFCHLSVYGKHINFGFNRATELAPHSVPLKGSGQLIRHLSVKDFTAFPAKDMEKLIWEAIGIAESRNPKLIETQGPFQSIVMSVSDKKRRPK